MVKEWGDLEGVNVFGKVVKVYDGDTVHVVAPVGEAGGEYLIKCRLVGIDAPELKVGHSARDTLVQLLERTSNIVQCYFGKKEKYGRSLVTLWQVMPNGSISNVNQDMVAMQAALPYDGGKKPVHQMSM